MTVPNSPKHDLSEGIAREHQELRELLRRVDEAVSAGESAGPKLQTVLGELSDELRVHFTQEETDGYFTDIVGRAPHLTDKVKELGRQHLDFLVTVRELIDLAGDSASTTEGRDRFEKSYRQFIEQFLAHEAAENDLVQEAYTTDIGSKD